MSEEFVRKDYHDATMREIKALMEANLAKQEAMNAEIRGEIKNLHTRIDGVIDRFSIAINDLKDSQTSNLTRWGIIVAIFVGVVQVTITLLLK